MKHIGTRNVHTGRLVLRRFTQEDAQAMYGNWASDPEVTKFLTWPTYTSVDTAHWILDSWVREYEKDDCYQWAIEYEGQPIGSISAVHINEKVASVEIGYCIGRPWWGRGIMTEALRAVIAYFFDEVGANRVTARHDPNNPASGAVMRKSGMTYEGTHRQSDRNNQGICDAAVYAIVAMDRKSG